MNKNYNQTDYLGDLKASIRLTEQIKAYYVARGIPIVGLRVWSEPEIDQYGSKFYSIRSNIVYNVKTMKMEVARNGSR